MSKALTIDNGTQFNNAKVKGFYEMYNIKINFSPMYHAQANGIVEAINKVIVANMRKCFEERREID